MPVARVRGPGQRGAHDAPDDRECREKPFASAILREAHRKALLSQKKGWPRYAQFLRRAATVRQPLRLLVRIPAPASRNFQAARFAPSGPRHPRRFVRGYADALL